MSTPQPNASPTVPLGMLQSIADAICDRPADSAAQCAARRRVVMDMAEGFQPRDAVEMMLVGMVIAHAHLLEDAVHDVYHGRDERVKARTKSTIAALGRGMFGFMRELRTAQKRRQKNEAAVGMAAAEVVTADAGAVAVNLPEKMPVAPKPVARKAGNNGTAPATVLPEPLAPLLRPTETAVAAMMAVLSPAMPPFVIPAALRTEESSPLPTGNSGPAAINATAERAQSRAA